MKMSSYYKFIKVNTTKRIISAKWRSHRYLSDIFKIKANLTTLTSLHVGSGEFSVYENLPLSKNIRDNEGRLIIPGSTLKGVVATYHLAIFNDPAETSSLFGYSIRKRGSYMSRVFFEDAKPVSSTNPKIIAVDPSWPPHRYEENHLKIYKVTIEYKESDTPVKYLECIPEGVKLETEIILVNGDKEEAAQIAVSLGYIPGSERTILIGYGKNKGLGKIRTEKLSITKMTFPILREEEIDIGDTIKALSEQYAERIEEVFDK